MTLTQEYQYIGRSSPVRSPSGYGYYVLVYARAVPAEDGTYTVGLRTRLACDADATFYAFTTTAYGKVDGVTAFEWSRKQIPYDYWGDSSSLTEGGETYRRWTELKEGSVKIAPGFGVEKSIAIVVSWVMNSSSSQSWFPATGVEAKAEISVVLPAIAGDTAFVLTGNGTTVDGNPYVNANGINGIKLTANGADSLTYNAEYLMGGTVLATQEGIRREHTLVIDPKVWLPYIPDRVNTVELPDADAPAVRITTVSGGTEAGIQTIRFDLYVPEDVIPKVTVHSVTPVGLDAPFDRVFLQGKSAAQADFTAEGAAGSSIVETVISAEGKTWSGDTTGILTGYGSVVVRVTATDTRGRKGYGESVISVTAYAKPKIEVSLCERCTAVGTPSDSGAYLNIRATRSYSRIEGNKCLIRYRIKSAAGDYGQWETILAEDADTDTVETGAINGTLDAKTAYSVQIGVLDTVGSAVETVFGLGGEEVYMHRTRNALGLGKYVQGERLLDCAWDAWFRGTILVGESGLTLEEYIRSIISGGET